MIKKITRKKGEIATGKIIYGLIKIVIKMFPHLLGYAFVNLSIC